MSERCSPFAGDSWHLLTFEYYHSLDRVAPEAVSGGPAVAAVPAVPADAALPVLAAGAEAA